jgi:hypothetical protein
MQAASAAPAGAPEGFPDFQGFEDAAAAAEPAAPAYAPASPPDDLEGAADGAPAAAQGGAPRARPALRCGVSLLLGLALSCARSAPSARVCAHKRARLSRVRALPRLHQQRCALRPATQPGPKQGAPYPIPQTRRARAQVASRTRTRTRALTWRRCWLGPPAAAPRRAAHPQDPDIPYIVLMPHGVTRTLLPSQSNVLEGAPACRRGSRSLSRASRRRKSHLARQCGCWPGARPAIPNACEQNLICEKRRCGAARW